MDDDMKFEIKSFGTRPNAIGFTNTPLGCIVYDSDGNFQLAGLNLTDEGEFIRAPGFGELPKILEKRIRDFCNAAFEGEMKSLGYQSFAQDVLKILDESP